jgi:glutathione S-transferase
MKLYTAPGSCSSAAHICLVRAELDFEAIKVDLRGDRSLPDGRHLNDINPKGYVPVLELDDGQFLTENVAILQYIADLKPESALAPANGTLDRVRLQEWLGFINSEIHKGFGALFNPDLPEVAKDMTIERLKGRMDYLENSLAGRNYLMGAQFTVVDAYLFIVLGWAPMFNFDLSPYPNVTAYLDRVAQVDAVKRVTAGQG